MYMFGKTQLVKMVIATAVLATPLLMPHKATAYEFEIKLAHDRNIAAGNDALKKGEVVKAVSSFNRALETNLSERQFFLAHEGLCIAYNKQEEYFRALDHCDQAVSLRKNYYGGYVNRGNVFLSLEQYDKAIENYEKAQELVPESFIPSRNIEIANLKRTASTPTFPTPPELMFDSCDHKPEGSMVAMN